MADGVSDVGPGTKTCQAQAGGDGHRQLPSTLGPRPSFQDHQPPIQQDVWARSGPAVSHGPKQSSAEPVSEFKLQLLDVGDRNHDFILERNEAIAMLESPTGSSQRPHTAEGKTGNRHREVTYAASVVGNTNRDGRPPRQDSAYYSSRGFEDDGSEIDFDAQARQLRARERIIIRRERLRRTRRSFRICRKRVQRLRDNVRDAVDKLTRTINELRALNLEIGENIDPYYDKLRIAQDELGPAEDEYDSLERRLVDEEDELEEEEDHFYHRNDLFNISVPENKIEAKLSPITEPSQTAGSDPTDFVLEDSLVREYLDKVEEAERLKEEVEELENEYLKATEDAAFRQRHAVRLSEETSKLLLDYPSLHAEALGDLRDAEDALFDTRDLCIEQGLFTESEYVYEPRDALCDEVMDTVYEARDRSPIRLAVYRLHYNDKDVDFADKRDYVNKWLLEWVEESSVGSLLLRAFIYLEFPDNTDELGDEKWSELAVENWDKDQAGNSANKNNRESRLDTIAGITPGVTLKKHATSTARSGVSSGSQDVLPDEEARIEPLNTPSESASHETQQAGSPITPKRKSASGTNEPITPMSLNTDSTPTAVYQVPAQDVNHPELALETALPTQEHLSPRIDNFSASIQSMNSLTTSAGDPSLQSSCTDTEIFPNLQPATCNPNDQPQNTAQITDSPEDALTLQMSDGPGTLNLPGSSSLSEGKAAVLSPPKIEMSQASLSNFQNDMTATPKARPTVDDTGHNNITPLLLDTPITKPVCDPEESALFEVLPSTNLHEDAIAPTPEPSLHNNNTTIIFSSTSPDPELERTGLWEVVSRSNSYDNTSHYASTVHPVQPAETPTAIPILDIPIITAPPEDPEPPRYRQRAKSDIVLPTFTLRTSSDHIPGRATLQVSADHARRRSLSPTRLFAVASHALQRASSYGSLHHLDPDLAAN
ncbi:hypothetical protein BDZ45DRAFT_371814 [Acephala macrosclerotiorum]|nr:hypothetical protein BDZ45DRAFT_371814 [Acephala macrosclerotiorum]